MTLAQQFSQAGDKKVIKLPSLQRLTVLRRPDHCGQRGHLIAAHRALPCALGRNGVTAIKREGDGATPLGVIMKPQMVYFRRDRLKRPATGLPTHPIQNGDLWCDDPDHPSYNMPVRVPFAASHEEMKRDDELYDLCVVLDFNRVPNARKRAGGSAIFMHCAKPGYPPTAGCIALARHDLFWLLTRINQHTEILVRH